MTNERFTEFPTGRGAPGGSPSVGPAVWPAGIDPPGSPRRVLVVDDSAPIRYMLRMILELSGHAVIEAPDGLSAVREFESTHPQVAFIDLQLPDIDGCEVAHRIRALPGGSDILLIAATGYDQDDRRSQAMSSGFDHYAVKPVSLDLIQEFVLERR